MSSVSGSIEWDGDGLVGWVAIDGVLAKVRVPRDLIHAHAAGFNDAVSWEIGRHREEIFEKLKPLLLQMKSGDDECGIGRGLNSLPAPAPNSLPI